MNPIDAQTLITFTSAQIASPLGVTRQAIQQRLATAPTSTFRLVNGNLAKAWSFEALPEAMQAELQGIAERRGYRSAVHLLGADREAWQRPVNHDPPGFDHGRLAQRLAFKDPAKPTLTERQNALEYSFVHLEDLAEQLPGMRSEIKQSILRFLWAKAPALAKSGEALKRTWYRKYDRWRKNGAKPSAVGDLRPANSGATWPAELEGDLELIVDEAWQHDGKLSIAIRKLRRAGKLSKCFLNRYTLDVRRDKSYVARSIRKEIMARLEGLLSYRHGQWRVNMQGPRIAREHNYEPGAYFSADDVTLDIVFHYTDDHGRPAVTRGEVLMFFDCRSLYPLGYVLTPGKYNGETLRRAIAHIHDRHGLPHVAYIFEKGVWASRLVLGERSRDFLSWDSYEMGLREHGLGLELRNVTTPQAKLCEGIFNILQQNQRNERGFVGFKEREYAQERLQTFIGRVKRGLVHPSKEFHSDAEWCKVLDRSLEAYMHEPQNGELLQGRTPAEVFAEHRALRKLPDGARFLIASHRVRAKVKSDGLTIKIRGKRRSFYNEALGKYSGRDVFAWFNLEQPDLLTVTDLDGKNPFSVKRHVLPAFEATDEQLEAVNRDRANFMRPAKIRFDQIQHPFRRSIVNDDVVDDDARALGARIRLDTEQHEAEQGARQRTLGRIARVAESAGIPMPRNIRNPQRVLDAMEAEKELRAEIAQEPKIYTLKSSPIVPSVGLYWSLWAQIQKARPGTPKSFRDALTQKTIHCHLMPQEMTPEQLKKMIDVFTAVIREAKKGVAV